MGSGLSIDVLLSEGRPTSRVRVRLSAFVKRSSCLAESPKRFTFNFSRLTNGPPTASNPRRSYLVVRLSYLIKFLKRITRCALSGDLATNRHE
jgi:hypothetical protein